MLSALLTVIQRDLLVAFRRRAELMNPILFYVIVVTLFPLGVSPDVEFFKPVSTRCGVGGCIVSSTDFHGKYFPPRF